MVVMQGGKNSERQDVRAKRDMKRGVWGLGWEVEWLPGLRSGLWPLMSIRPFGAYCRVRGLDFYGDGFHLLESPLSVSTTLHLSPPTVLITRFFLPPVFPCIISGFGKLSSHLASFLSPLSPLYHPLNLTVGVFIQPHQDQHDPLWYFPNAILCLLTHT